MSTGGPSNKGRLWSKERASNESWLAQLSALRITMGTDGSLVFIQACPRVQHKIEHRQSLELQAEGSSGRGSSETLSHLPEGQASWCTVTWSPQPQLGILGPPSSPNISQGDTNVLC